VVFNCGQSAVDASITAMPAFYAADGTELAYHVQGEDYAGLFISAVTAFLDDDGLLASARLDIGFCPIMAWSKKYRYANGSENCGPSGIQQGSVQSGDEGQLRLGGRRSPEMSCDRY
jgi:hypothetical protein